MLGKLDLSRVGPVLLLLAAGAGVAGCQKNQPPQQATQPYSTSFSASGWTFHLRHLKPDAQADADKAREVWRDLFPGMAKDATTRDLLRRLHGDLPVELVVLDAKQAWDKAVLMAPQHRAAELAPTELRRPHVAARQVGPAEVAVVEVIRAHP